MAMIEDIGRAKLYQIALQRAFNARPSLDIQPDYVRVHYTGNDLIQAQNEFKKLLTKPAGAVRVEIAPALMPGLIKKYGIFLIAFLIGGVLLGRQIG